MKIITILKEFNIGLDTLNSEIKKLGLSNEFSINSKISKEDCEFLEHLLSNVKKEEKLKDEICKIRENIKGLFLRNISAPQKMGELEKRQLFMCIQSQRIESILMPYFEEYSEENFWSLYNWHIKWDTCKTLCVKFCLVASFCSKVRNFAVQKHEDYGRIQEVVGLHLALRVY